MGFTPPCTPLFAWRSISDCTRDQLVDACSLGAALGGSAALGGNITPPWETLVWPGGVPGSLKLDSFKLPTVDAVAAGSA